MRTMVDLIQEQGERYEDEIAYRFLPDGAEDEEVWTHADLLTRAGGVAARLGETLRPNDRVLLFLAPGLDYLAAFYGCILAGVIAVPAYPPDPSRLDRTLPRLSAIARDADVHAVLTTTEIASFKSLMGSVAPELHGLSWITVDDAPGCADAAFRAPRRRPEDIAFLQYSSGSTGVPKGVMLTHANLLANLESIRRTFRTSNATHVVSWLPPYHDMGLIGGILQPLFCGGTATLLSPRAFLRSPLRWLSAISRFGGTLSGGPNFAFDLCVRKIGEEDRDRLDLGSWEIAFNGAEPVRRTTLDRFASHFERSGFRRQALFPCYGLAEATLLVSGGFFAPEPAEPAFRFAPVDCGPPADGTEVRIVEPERRVALEEGDVGEIWVRSKSVGAGYWGKPALSEETFRARLAASPDGATYLRTGDLGVLRGGHLHVAGRRKDLLVVRGRNVHPQDVELSAVAAHPSLRPGGAAAFALDDGDAERVALVLETDTRAGSFDVEALASVVREAVANDHDVHVDTVAFVPAGSVPKTSSGKVQRFLAREQLLAGALPLLGRDEQAPRDLAAPPAALDRAAYAALPPAERAASLRRLVTGLVASLAGLPTEAIDPDEPLARYGLDSMATAELAAALDALTADMRACEELDHATTVDAITRALETSLASAEPARVASPAPGRSGELSFGQKALVFLHQCAPEDTTYNVAVAVRVPASIPPDAWRRAFDTVSARHDALHTRVEVDAAGEARRVVDATFSAPLCVVASAGSGDGEVRASLQREAARPFEVVGGALVRAALYERAEGEHVLFLAAHHMLCDLWSLGVILDEVVRTATGAEPRSTPRSYDEFVAWQRAWIESPRGEQALDFWERSLASFEEPVGFPQDTTTEAPPQSVVETYAFGIDGALGASLRAAAARAKLTPFALLLSAYQVLLARSADATDVTVATPAHGRPTRGFSATVGFFVNTLVLRADLSDNPPLAVFVRRNGATLRDSLEHAHAPLSLVFERLRRRGGDHARALASTLFVLEKTPQMEGLGAVALGVPDAQVSIHGHVLRSYGPLHATAEYEVVLSVAEQGDAYAATFHFDATRFERASVARWTELYLRILRAIVSHDTTPVFEVSLVDGVAPPAGGEGRPAAYVPMLRRIHEVARKNPSAVAGIDARSQLTYGELCAWSARIADDLQSIGLGRGDRVVICLSRDVAWLAAFCGIWRAGGVPVPLSLEDPIERLRMVVGDAGARAAVVDAKGNAFVASLGLPASRADVLRDGETKEPAAPVSHHEGEAAYLIYTSGTTGTPKGVVVSHGALAGHIDAIARAWALEPEDHILQFGAPSFDASLEQIFGALATGATVVLRGDELWEPAAFLDACASHRITVADIPTAYFHLLTELSGLDFTAAPSLRLVIVGGEALSRRALERWQRARRPPRLVNAYGPTEATITATFHDCGGAFSPGPNVPIGRALPGKPVWVVNHRGSPCPPGVVGELCIGGELLATGYWGKPALTAERFGPLPALAAFTERVYRTGDRARVRNDGLIELRGRTDAQVKIRGHRVELSEVERTIEQHPWVVQAAVTLEDGPSGPALVGFVVLGAGAADAREDASEALRSFVSARLPSAMVPGAFVRLEAIPRNSSGKLDRGRLARLPVRREARVERDLDVIEQIVASLWAPSLTTPNLDRGSDFFALGGHSLLAARLAARLSRIFRVEVRLSRLLAAPTLSGWAEAVRSANPSPERLEAVAATLRHVAAKTAAEDPPNAGRR
ncbi:non-ribosomal peptide synthetase [Polyangium sp. y55x31]|uniref:non-ribosomal peptide synthetase n=1 Tax=Polyangium sp. y55x31 TaxID=3042688 RepID=UPI0024828357|nr:non-ribosomal peptide synthetase [Polyangium sp. y55x31]MDI1480357.1 amino acid adenylation domain-containing protein [Polyangium sp. y55x31]